MNREEISKMIQSNSKLDKASKEWIENIIDSVFFFFEQQEIISTEIINNQHNLMTNAERRGHDKLFELLKSDEKLKDISIIGVEYDN